MLGLLKRRLVGAGTYSLEGLKACFQHEEAFRVEVVVGLLLCVLSPWVASNILQWALLVSAILLVLIVELLNSGIEAAIDRIGPEQHELSKRAKDIGSAAVMLSLVMLLLVWGSVIVSNFYY